MKRIKIFMTIIIAFGIGIACIGMKSVMGLGASLYSDSSENGGLGRPDGTYSMVTSKDYSYGGVSCICVFSSNVTIYNHGNSARLNNARVDSGLAGGSSSTNFNNQIARVYFHVDGIDPGRVNRSYDTYHQY